MEDKAYYYIYGRVVFHPMRVALIALLQEYAHGRYEEHPTTGIPFVDQKRVQDKVARSHNPPQSHHTVMKALSEAIDLGLMSKADRGQGIKKNKAYLYFSDEQYRKVIELNELFAKIDEVIEVQANSADKLAGMNLLPPEVFYNIEVDDGS